MKKTKCKNIGFSVVISPDNYTMLPHQISLSAEKEMIRRMQRQAEIVEALGLMDEAQEEK